MRHTAWQLTQLCLIYIWIHLEVHVKRLATEKKSGRIGARRKACKMPSAGRSQAPQKTYGWEMIQALIFLPLYPADVKLPVTTDYDDHDVSGVYVFMHTCAVASC